MKKLFSILSFVLFGFLTTPANSQELTDAQTEEAITFAQNATAYVLYHEIGHLFVSQFELPILGKEEDAADNIATLMLLEMGTEATDNTLLDAAHSWFLSNNQTTEDYTDAEFYDSHSLDIQRAFQIICLMVGADPDLFAEVATQVGIDEDRQVACSFDYQQLGGNWVKLRDAFVNQGEGGAPITVEYEEPNPDFEYAANILMNSKIMEIAASEIATNYVLPRAAKFVGRNCDQPNAFYDPELEEVVMCYELTAMFADFIVQDILDYPEG